MSFSRSAGVLCHISSLPGKYGIGTLGKEAYAFADLIKLSGVTYWQILPLMQTGYGDSPYSSVFCNSGNPYFLDLETFAREGLLTEAELTAAQLPEGDIDYGRLYRERYETLRLAFSRFATDEKEFLAYLKGGSAEDYALFMTAKTVFGGDFRSWDEEIKRHDSAALAALKTEHKTEYLFWQFLQFEFQKQWKKLKDYCNGMGIKIIGDLPLYVAYDSADVWAHPELFELDEELNPKLVAGVPPDYFCATGQLWGNPVYRWAQHEKEGFSWWNQRLTHAFEWYDVLRIDHFRGIDRFYAIPYGSKTAEIGSWLEGPKDKLFQGMRGSVIAEDLGVVDEGVTALVKRTGFPGMKVLLFAFDGNENNPFLPHNYTKNCVVYTGTHDNDTVYGYLATLSKKDRLLFRRRVEKETERMGLPHERYLIKALSALALQSEAALAVLPVQDILGLDNASRMNYPGTESGNWRFRLKQLPSKYRMKKFWLTVKKFRR